MNSSLKTIIFLVLVFLLTACSKNQDDIDLPIYDNLGGNFSLPATNDKIAQLNDFKGKVVLLNFGYTNCPDICPAVLTRLGNLVKKVGENAIHVQVLFITVDPERDTTAYLKEYLSFFNDQFIGMSGTLEQTNKVAKQFAVFFQKEESKASEDKNYQMVHNDKIFLIDKKGRLRALFGTHDTDEKIIDLINQLANAEI